MGGYLAGSTGAVVRAVVFDVFGTVVDWRSGIADAVGAFATAHGIELDAAAFADAWRERYQPSMEEVRSGRRPFVSLDVLHRENLDDVLRARGLDPAAFGADELDMLSRAWHFLPPWPDSVAGIGQLKRDYIVGPMSNGNTALLLDMAKAAGIPWDLVLGSDAIRAFKPHRDAYLRPVALLGLEPGEVMLVAAHPNDLAEARVAGLATGFVPRPEEHGPARWPSKAPMGNWDLTAPSISALADQMCRLVLVLVLGVQAGQPGRQAVDGRLELRVEVDEVA